MPILDESKNHILYNDYESVYVKQKSGTQEQFYIGEHYGDPTCGIIAPSESWFLAGGEGLTFFDFPRGLVELMRDAKLIFDIDSRNKIKAQVDRPHYPVHSVKLESNDSVRILIDPWSNLASTWLLNIPDLKLTKLRDGPSLVEQPYQEEVEF